MFIFSLLSFEELLVELSDGIILFVESFGTACELGTFSMKEEIISRLLVFNDIKYKNSPSFINDRPIQKIINRNNQNVIFTNMETVLQHPNSFQKLINFIPKEKNIKLNDSNKVKLNSFF